MLNFRTVLGLLLIVLGAIGLWLGEWSFTKTETIFEAGPIQASADTRETIPIPPWVAGIVLGAGVVVLLTGVRTQKS